jgi:hypothetical protein
LFGQSEKPQTIIIPTGSLGEISEIRKKMLEKTLESKLDDYFAIVPKELFEDAQEQAFEELDYDECTEDQCIRMIQELLQVENAFKMDLMYEEGDTQISITWNDQDQKRVEEDYCEGCKTKELRNMIGGLVEKLVGEKPMVVVGTPKVLPKKVQEPETIRSCFANYYSSSGKDNVIRFPNNGGKPYGLAIQHLLLITNKLGFKVNMKEESGKTITKHVRSYGQNKTRILGIEGINKCFEQMEKGTIDIMSYLSYKPERTKYMHLIKYSEFDGGLYYGISKKSKFSKLKGIIENLVITLKKEIEDSNKKLFTNSKQHDWDNFQ